MRRKQRPKHESRTKSRQARATPSPIIEEQTPKPTEKGFTLRFASDEALQKQIASGSVSLFAMAEKQAWRLSLPTGRPVIHRCRIPGLVS